MPPIITSTTPSTVPSRISSTSPSTILSTVHNLLSPYLLDIEKPTLWLADENALEVIEQLPDCINNTGENALLHIVSNRYDVHQTAMKKGFYTEFNDFLLDHLPQQPERIIYHISKEKPLTHYLLNQASALLSNNAELIIIGQKQQGVKTYSEKLVRHLGFTGKLKKSGNYYSACFTRSAAVIHEQDHLDDQQYRELHQLPIEHHKLPLIYSKPGVFGWKKVDQGTELLLATLPKILENIAKQPQSLLDLGCGYGWIFLNLSRYFSDSQLEAMNIVATDNNAAAIRCAKKNAQQTSLNIHIVAADCASSIEQKFDLILCNPPFHQGFTHNQSLTEKFFKQTKSHLNQGGIAVWVVNEFIGLDSLSKSYQLNCKKIVQRDGFAVHLLSAK